MSRCWTMRACRCAPARSSAWLESKARDIDWAHLVSGRAAVSYGERAIYIGFSAFTVIVKVCRSEVSTPLLAVPPLSCTFTSKVDVPAVFVAGV